MAASPFESATLLELREEEDEPPKCSPFREVTQFLFIFLLCFWYRTAY